MRHRKGIPHTSVDSVRRTKRHRAIHLRESTLRATPPHSPPTLERGGASREGFRGQAETKKQSFCAEIEEGCVSTPKKPRGSPLARLLLGFCQFRDVGTSRRLPAFPQNANLRRSPTGNFSGALNNGHGRYIEEPLTARLAARMAQLLHESATRQLTVFHHVREGSAPAHGTGQRCEANDLLAPHLIRRSSALRR